MDYFPSTTTTTQYSCSSKEKTKKKKGNNGNTSNNNNKRSSSSKGVMKLSTDPQSVAARERRHRISDRFKILQSLVPGGSKMDTVSMLEEAIHYVKFLKTQIWLHQTIINCHVDVVDDYPTATTAATVFLNPPDFLPSSHHHQLQTDHLYATGNGSAGNPVVQQPPPPAMQLPPDSYCFESQETGSFDPYLKF